MAFVETSLLPFTILESQTISQYFFQMSTPKTVQEKAPKFRVREEVEPTQQFARRVGSRTPQVKSVYSLLREILSKKVERLEEARVADEKAKAQGKSGFAKLEN